MRNEWISVKEKVNKQENPLEDFNLPYKLVYTLNRWQGQEELGGPLANKTYELGGRRLLPECLP